MTTLAAWWALALVFLLLGAGLLVRPDALVARQRRLLEWQLAMLDRGSGRALARLTGGLLVASGVLMALLLLAGRRPFEAFL